MAASTPLWFNVFVGAETGFLKGVNLKKHYFKNVNNLETKREEILSMCWGNADDTNIYCALKNRHVKVYDVLNNTYRDAEFVVTGGKGDIRGFVKTERGYITSVESGLLRIWDDDGKLQASKSVGRHTHRMRHNPAKPWLVATGGRHFRNDLTIWNIESLDKPVFSAVNVPNDFLDIPVPIWVTDMQFIRDSECVAVCTGHGHVRLYDPRVKGRPVISMNFDQYPLTSMAIAHKKYQIIVGGARGRVALFDIRKSKVYHSYKSFAGSVRGIHVHPTKDLVATCGLDRFLRIHELTKIQAKYKVYMKSRLNCVLFREAEDPSCEQEKSDDLIEGMPENPVDEDENPNDKCWSRMELIDDDNIPRQSTDNESEPEVNANKGKVKKVIKRKQVQSSKKFMAKQKKRRPHQ